MKMKNGIIFTLFLYVAVVDADDMHELGQMLADCHTYLTSNEVARLTPLDSEHLYEIIAYAYEHKDGLSAEQLRLVDELAALVCAIHEQATVAVATEPVDGLVFTPVYRVPPTPTDLVKVVGGIGFKAPGGNTVVMSPALDTDLWTFQLPPNAGDPGDVLTTDGTGVITWEPGSSAGTCEIVSTCTYFAIEIPDGLDTYELVMQPNTNIQPTFELALAGSVPDISLELLIKGSGALYAVSDTAEVDAFFFVGPNVLGNARGVNAVDLQLTRTSGEFVASGNYSAMVGGINNQAPGVTSVAIGGVENEAFGFASGAFAGFGNIIGGSDLGSLGSVIIGGNNHTVFGSSSGVIAGSGNALDGDNCAIVAGQNNNINSATSLAVVIGGDFNSVSGSRGVVVGGNANTVTGLDSIVLGGFGSVASGNFSLAAGSAAQATHDGSFVWTSNGAQGSGSNGTNTFNVYGSGVFFPTGITSVTVTGAPVLIDATTGQLGTISSARRYKENIKAMPNEYSASVLELQPVTFNYKKTPEVESFGLIAEEVLERFPQLVLHNKDGEIETVKYHELPVLLLNELKKQNARTDRLQAQVEMLQAQLTHLLTGR